MLMDVYKMRRREKIETNKMSGELEMRSRIVVQPCCGTPPELKHFKLCLLDQLSTPMHGNMTFFYPNYSDDDDFSSKSLSLQTSLSRTLARFHHLGGRFLDSSTILCSDEGVSFVEAHCPLPLHAFLSAPHLPSLDALVPSPSPDDIDTILLAQFTSFQCGSTALSLSLSHKVSDVATFITLLRSWSDTARGSPHPLLPTFLGASLLPPLAAPPSISTTIPTAAANFSARRFVFSPDKIAELRALAGGASRVEAVLALIWKCAMSADQKSSKSGRFRASAMFQAVNLRRRTDPPLPDTAVGNFIWPIMVVAEEEGEADDLKHLVALMRKALEEFKANRLIKGPEALKTVMEEVKQRKEAMTGLHVYKCTSWCRFPIFDSSDFGWGKAAWHYSANKMMSNTIALMDTKSGQGVEAVVTLDNDHLSFFECDHHLLTYASTNPAIYTHTTHI